MDYLLRLNSNRIYTSDLKTIIDSIKMNGNNAKCHSITLSHPKGVEIALFMNFALEQNSYNPPTNASLKILGFKIKNGNEFLFNINPFPCQNSNKNAQKIAIDGTYKSLGFPMELPKITAVNLFESIVILNNYDTVRPIEKKECEAITRLIIATSEAIRFSSVANGISSVLENDTAFTPNSFEIIGWGGHSMAC